MKPLKVLAVILGLASSAAFAGRGGGGKPICTGNEPPRRGAPYVLKVSGEERLSAYLDALARYEVEHPEAAEYAEASAKISGQSCFSDDDCAYGDNSKFAGSCVRYEWDGTNGSCYLHAVVAIPQPPTLAALSCADVTCPAQFQCEVEESNGAVGCVEQRTCREPR